MARQRRFEVHGEGFWISYSDLTTGLLLIFVVLVAAMIAHYHKKQEAILTAVDGLLLVEDQLAERLALAANRANTRLGYPPADPRAFQYDAVQKQVLIQEGAWFDKGSAELKPEAERALEAFLPILYHSLLVEQTTDGRDPLEFLAAIEIQGHTDPVWAGTELWSWESYYSNTVLSNGRAAAVAAFMGELIQSSQGGENQQWRPFFAYIQTGGRSWMESYCRGEVLQPSDFRDGTPCPGERLASDDPRSRRVTFGIRINNERVIEEIERTVDETRQGLP